MELAFATMKAKTHSLLAAALWQVLLLIAISYGIAYIVPACFNLASRQAGEEPRTGILPRGAGAGLDAKLVCASAEPRLSERSTCDSLIHADPRSSAK